MSSRTYSIDEAMALAVDEAKRGFPYVSPNPPVGCVILNENYQLLATGFHSKHGESHAEIEALKKVKDKSLLKGAHLIVTLEPCSHQGRTGSCAQEITHYPFSSVTYGCVDLNPKVNGSGINVISNSGIEINKFSPLERYKYISTELELLIDVFQKNIVDEKIICGHKNSE